MAADLLLLFQDRIRAAGPFDNARLAELLGDAGEELTADLEWSWSLSRSPIQLRLQGDAKENLARVERRLQAWEARAELTLGAADRERLTRALRSFTESIATLRYESRKPR